MIKSSLFGRLKISDIRTFAQNSSGKHRTGMAYYVYLRLSAAALINTPTRAKNTLTGAHMASQMINSAIGSLATAALVESPVRLRRRVGSSPWLPRSSADKFTHPYISQPEKKKWRRIRFCDKRQQGGEYSGRCRRLYFGCIAAGIPKPLLQARTQLYSVSINIARHRTR
jgi:hypothetical protein